MLVEERSGIVPRQDKQRKAMNAYVQYPKEGKSSEWDGRSIRFKHVENSCKSEESKEEDLFPLFFFFFSSSND